MTGTCNECTESLHVNYKVTIRPQQQLLVQVKWPKVQEIEEMAKRYEEGGSTSAREPKIGAWQEVRKGMGRECR